MSDRTEYRDYLIYDKPESFKPTWARFEFHHKDFDLDDTRYGHAATLEEAKADIDERIAADQDRSKESERQDHEHR